MEKSNKNSEKRKGIEKQIPAALTTNNPLERYTRGTGILLVALSIIGFFMLWPIYLPPLLSIGGAALILTKKFQKEPFVENKPLTKGGLLGKKSEKTIMRAEMKTLGIAESKSKIAPEKVVTFRSVAWSRLLSGFLTIGIGVVNAVVFGLDITEKISTKGTYFVLGGPSLFYPMSLFPLIFAVALLIYGIVSKRDFEIKCNEIFLSVKEKRFVPRLTTIPKQRIEKVSISNRQIWPKTLWILAYGIHLMFCFIDGFHFLFNEHAYGSGILAGWMFLINGVVQLIAMGILLLAKEYRILIETDNKEYIYSFYLPRNNRFLVYKNLLKLLDLELEKREIQLTNEKRVNDKRDKKKREKNISRVEKKFVKSRISLTVALILGGLSILSITLNVFAGLEFSIGLALSAFLLTTRYVKTEGKTQLYIQTRKSSSESGSLVAKKRINIENEYGYSERCKFFLNLNRERLNNDDFILKTASRNPLEYLFYSSLIFFAINCIASYAWFTPTDVPAYNYQVMNVVFGLFIIIIAADLFFRPSIFLHIEQRKTEESIELELHISRRKDYVWGKNKSWKALPKTFSAICYNDLKKTTFRIVVFALAVGLGVIFLFMS